MADLNLFGAMLKCSDFVVAEDDEERIRIEFDDTAVEHYPPHVFGSPRKPETNGGHDYPDFGGVSAKSDLGGSIVLLNIDEDFALVCRQPSENDASFEFQSSRKFDRDPAPYFGSNGALGPTAQEAFAARSDDTNAEFHTSLRFEREPAPYASTVGVESEQQKATSPTETIANPSVNRPLEAINPGGTSNPEKQLVRVSHSPNDDFCEFHASGKFEREPAPYGSTAPQLEQQQCLTLREEPVKYDLIQERQLAPNFVGRKPTDNAQTKKPKAVIDREEAPYSSTSFSPLEREPAPYSTCSPSTSNNELVLVSHQRVRWNPQVYYRNESPKKIVSSKHPARSPETPSVQMEAQIKTETASSKHCAVDGNKRRTMERARQSCAQAMAKGHGTSRDESSEASESSTAASIDEAIVREVPPTRSHHKKEKQKERDIADANSAETFPLNRATRKADRNDVLNVKVAADSGGCENVVEAASQETKRNDYGRLRRHKDQPSATYAVFVDDKTEQENEKFKIASGDDETEEKNKLESKVEPKLRGIRKLFSKRETKEKATEGPEKNEVAPVSEAEVVLGKPDGVSKQPREQRLSNELDGRANKVMHTVDEPELNAVDNGPNAALEPANNDAAKAPRGLFRRKVKGKPEHDSFDALDAEPAEKGRHGQNEKETKDEAKAKHQRLLNLPKQKRKTKSSEISPDNDAKFDEGIESDHSESKNMQSNRPNVRNFLSHAEDHDQVESTTPSDKAETENSRSDDDTNVQSNKKNFRSIFKLGQRESNKKVSLAEDDAHIESTVPSTRTETENFKSVDDPNDDVVEEDDLDRQPVKRRKKWSLSDLFLRKKRDPINEESAADGLGADESESEDSVSQKSDHDPVEVFRRKNFPDFQPPRKTHSFDEALSDGSSVASESTTAADDTERESEPMNLLEERNQKSHSEPATGSGLSSAGPEQKVAKQQHDSVGSVNPAAHGKASHLERAGKQLNCDSKGTLVDGDNKSLMKHAQGSRREAAVSVKTPLKKKQSIRNGAKSENGSEDKKKASGADSNISKPSTDNASTKPNGVGSKHTHKPGKAKSKKKKATASNPVELPIIQNPVPPTSPATMKSLSANREPSPYSMISTSKKNSTADDNGEESGETLREQGVSYELTVVPPRAHIPVAVNKASKCPTSRDSERDLHKEAPAVELGVREPAPYSMTQVSSKAIPEVEPQKPFHCNCDEMKTVGKIDLLYDGPSAGVRDREPAPYNMDEVLQAEERAIAIKSIEPSPDKVDKTSASGLNHEPASRLEMPVICGVKEQLDVENRDEPMNILLIGNEEHSVKDSVIQVDDIKPQAVVNEEETAKAREEKIGLCLAWYNKLARPTREEMKNKVRKMDSSCGITEEDVDAMPWMRSGRMLESTSMRTFCALPTNDVESHLVPMPEVDQEQVLPLGQKYPDEESNQGCTPEHATTLICGVHSNERDCLVQVDPKEELNAIEILKAESNSTPKKKSKSSKKSSVPISLTKTSVGPDQGQEACVKEHKCNEPPSSRTSETVETHHDPELIANVNQSSKKDLPKKKKPKRTTNEPLPHQPTGLVMEKEPSIKQTTSPKIITETKKEIIVNSTKETEQAAQTISSASPPIKPEVDKDPPTPVAPSPAAPPPRRKRAEEAKKKEVNVELRMKCYMWYARMGQPNRDAMKRRVAKLTDCDITVEDVDELPWICGGSMVSVREMNDLISNNKAVEVPTTIES